MSVAELLPCRLILPLHHASLLWPPNPNLGRGSCFCNGEEKIHISREWFEVMYQSWLIIMKLFLISEAFSLSTHGSWKNTVYLERIQTFSLILLYSNFILKRCFDQQYFVNVLFKLSIQICCYDTTFSLGAFCYDWSSLRWLNFTSGKFSWLDYSERHVSVNINACQSTKQALWNCPQVSDTRLCQGTNLMKGKSLQF